MLLASVPLNASFFGSHGLPLDICRVILMVVEGRDGVEECFAFWTGVVSRLAISEVALFRPVTGVDPARRCNVSHRRRVAQQLTFRNTLAS